MKAVLPWAAALAVPAGVAAVFVAGGGPGVVVAALAVALLVAAAVGAGGLLAVLLVAFPFGPKFSFGPGNLYVSTALVFVAIFAWMLTVIYRRGSFRWLPRALGMPLVALAALMLISALAHAGDLAAHPADFLRLVQLLAVLALLPLAYDLAPRGSRAAALVMVAVGAGVAQALYGIFIAGPGPRGFVVGSFDYEHNGFGAEMVLAALVSAGLLLAVRGARRRLLLAGGLAALLAALVLSQSRTGYLGVAAGALLLVSLPVARRRRLLILASLAVAVLAAAFLAPPGLRDRVSGAFSGAAGENGSLSLARRLALWTGGLDAVRGHLLFGEGIWSRALADNFFLKTLVELGLVGLALLAWFMVALLAALRRAAIACPPAGGLVAAGAALLVVMNVAGDYFLMHRVMGTFWLLAGLGLRRAEEA